MTAICMPECEITSTIATATTAMTDIVATTIVIGD